LDFFVSCRGKNNPVDYTLRSLENGKICIIDTETMKVIKSFEGGNQPTGLDISLDGKSISANYSNNDMIEIVVDNSTTAIRSFRPWKKYVMEVSEK
jgi:DNA-binding beta-propeller fold protein YncE